MKIDSILFDLDGTLWDSVAGVSYAWRKVIDKHGLRSPVSDEELADCMGLTTTEIAEKIFPFVESELRNAIVEECFAEEHAYLRQVGGKVYPGVEETLDYLSQRYRLAIVSNCEAGYIECFFDITGLGRFFTDYECFGNTGKEKEENILMVLQRLATNNAIFIGDMIKDQTAAEAAGIPFICARYGFGKGILAPLRWDYAINSFSELIPLVQKITV